MIVLAQVVSTGSGFTNFINIPQNFTHLQIRYQGRGSVSAATDNFFLRFNSDTTGPYYYTYTNNNWTSSTSTTSSNGGYMPLGNMPASTSAANYFGGGIIDIYNYTSASKTKAIKGLWGYDLNGAGQTGHTTGYWVGTGAITNIQFGTASAVDATGAVATLYGITSANTYGVSAP